MEKSYSQCYEDIIIDGLLKVIDFEVIDFDKYTNNKITYVDCGANHPVSTSNTYLFYERGIYGILVEPNESIAEEIKKIRGKDKLIEAVVSDKYDKELEFFFATDSEISSLNIDFIKKWYNIVDKTELDKIKSCKLKNFHINDILKEVDQTKLWILSIDCEGEDSNIIKAIDFKRFKPNVVLFEHSSDFFGEAYSILTKYNYILVNITRVNSIFIKTDKYKQNSLNLRNILNKIFGC
jgi:FkbM family methyltransferase